jgi:hypothetical protein
MLFRVRFNLIFAERLVLPHSKAEDNVNHTCDLISSVGLAFLWQFLQLATLRSRR